MRKFLNIVGVIVIIFAAITMAGLILAALAFLMLMLHLVLGLFGYVVWFGVLCIIGVYVYAAIAEDRK